MTPEQVLQTQVDNVRDVIEKWEAVRYEDNPSAVVWHAFADEIRFALGEERKNV